MRVVIDILLFAFLACLLIFAVIMSGLLVVSAVKAVIILLIRDKKPKDKPKPCVACRYRYYGKTDNFCDECIADGKKYFTFDDDMVG